MKIPAAEPVEAHCIFPVAEPVEAHCLFSVAEPVEADCLFSVAEPVAALTINLTLRQAQGPDNKKPFD